MGHVNLNGGLVYRKRITQRQKALFGQEVSAVDLARVGILVIQFSLPILPVGVQKYNIYE